jgi:hypothetical protein
VWAVPYLDAEELEEVGPDASGTGFELSVRIEQNITHDRPEIVDIFVHDLRREDGIDAVLREDREVVLVRSASWDAAAVETWGNRSFRERVPDG